MAVTPTYVALGTITLASTDSEIVFSSIPATYRDLIVVISGQSSRGIATTGFGVRLNGNTGSNYSRVTAYGNGSATSSDSATGTQIDFPSSGTVRSTNIVQIFDYAQTDKHKTVLITPRNTTHLMGMLAARFADTAAVHTVTIREADGFQFTVGSTVSLYGIA
jgi:hypothetical protein